MKLLTVFLLSILISGCSIFRPKLTAAKPDFPEPVHALTLPCPELQQIESEKVTITDLMKSVVENYTKYYQCSSKNDGWNQWYKDQKAIYDKVK